MLWIAVLVVVGLIIVLVAIGFALPRGHINARRAVLARPPDQVWRAISDVAAYPTWRRGVTAVEPLSATEFRERSSHGVIRYEVVEARAPALRITRIADPGLPFGGRWIFELAADGAATRLTITEDGFIENPIFRLLSRTVFSTATTLEHFLTDLAAHLAVAATPEPAPASPRVAAEPPTAA